MIIVTGAAGFIGSCLVNKLNNKGFKDIVIVDEFTNYIKSKNLANKVFSQKVDREFFFDWLEKHHKRVNFIFHLGARTDTAEFSKTVFDQLNLNYSKKLWEACVEYDLPLVYASSAATYGDGKLGYKDSHELVEKLKPLNPYGESKNEFDKWALRQEKKPYFWAGLKFFNVYGPNEYHKGRMASVVYHAYKQISETGKIKLFKSHNPDYEDGKQLRDFVFVKDVVNVCFFMMLKKKYSGLYNLGTGEARTFLDLALAVFDAMEQKAEVEYIDMPEDIRDKYQYFTEADIAKLRSIGYNLPLYTLEQGVSDYVQGYLAGNVYY